MCVTALMIVLMTSGCARSRGVSTVQASVSSPYPAVSSFVETAAPTMRYRDFALAGSYGVAAYTDRFALLVRNTGARYPSGELHLLDLRDGSRKALLTTPRERRLGYDILGYKLSDEVVAWEECSPNDLDDPQHLGWALLASKFDAAKGLVGSSVTLDRSTGGRRGRPMFGVDGTRVVWMQNTLVIRDGRVSGQRDGIVKSQDLRGGSARVVATSAAGFETLTLSEGRPLLQSWDATGPSHTLRILEPAGAAKAMTLGPAPVSHFPAAHAGRVAWAAGSPASDWPSLYLRGPSGGIALVGADALDPVFAAAELFFESNETSGAAHRADIWVSRPDSGVKAKLVETDVSTEGWWHPALAQGYLARTFVAFNDLSPWNGGKDPRTLIRVYDLGGR